MLWVLLARRTSPTCRPRARSRVRNSRSRALKCANGSAASTARFWSAARAAVWAKSRAWMQTFSSWRRASEASGGIVLPSQMMNLQDYRPVLELVTNLLFRGRQPVAQVILVLEGPARQLHILGLRFQQLGGGGKGLGEAGGQSIGEGLPLLEPCRGQRGQDFVRGADRNRRQRVELVLLREGCLLIERQLLPGRRCVQHRLPLLLQFLAGGVRLVQGFTEGLGELVREARNRIRLIEQAAVLFDGIDLWLHIRGNG